MIPSPLFDLDSATFAATARSPAAAAGADASPSAAGLPSLSSSLMNESIAWAC